MSIPALATMLAALVPSAVEPSAPRPDPVRASVQEAIASLTLVQPDSTSGDSAARMTVVNFFATWCHPCLDLIPKHNEILQAVQGTHDIAMLSVSTEAPAELRKFLRVHRMKGAVASDSESELHRLLGVEALPTTVLLAPDGETLAEIPSDQLSERLLIAAVAGKPVGVVTSSNSTNASEQDCDKQPAVLAAYLRRRDFGPGEAVRSVVHFDDRGLRGEALSLSMLLQHAYGVRGAQVDWNFAEGKERYDLCIHGAMPHFDWRSTLQSMLRSSFAIDARETREEREIYQLIGCAPRLPASTADEESSVTRSSGRVEARRIDTFNLALVLEDVLNEPVENATLVRSEFNIDLEWKPGNEESLRKALQGYGLDLKRRRSVERRLIVSRAACLSEPATAPGDRPAHD